MTDKDKLERCIDFIKKIESLPQIKECDPDEYDIREYNKLRDQAWHILADITD